MMIVDASERPSGAPITTAVSTEHEGLVIKGLSAHEEAAVVGTGAPSVLQLIHPAPDGHLSHLQAGVIQLFNQTQHG